MYLYLLIHMPNKHNFMYMHSLMVNTIEQKKQIFCLFMYVCKSDKSYCTMSCKYMYTIK